MRFREDSGKVQGRFREGSEKVQRRFRKNSEKVHGSLREGLGRQERFQAKFKKLFLIFLNLLNLSTEQLT